MIHFLHPCSSLACVRCAGRGEAGTDGLQHVPQPRAWRPVEQRPPRLVGVPAVIITSREKRTEKGLGEGKRGCMFACVGVGNSNLDWVIARRPVGQQPQRLDGVPAMIITSREKLAENDLGEGKRGRMMTSGGVRNSNVECIIASRPSNNDHQGCLGCLL